MTSAPPTWLRRALLYGLVVFALVLAALLLVLWVGGGSGDIPYEYDGFD